MERFSIILSHLYLVSNGSTKLSIDVKCRERSILLHEPYKIVEYAICVFLCVENLVCIVAAYKQICRTPMQTVVVAGVYKVRKREIK